MVPGYRESCVTSEVTCYATISSEEQQHRTVDIILQNKHSIQFICILTNWDSEGNCDRRTGKHMRLSDRTKQWLNASCKTSLKGKTILVTGANSGVGFKTAEIAVYLGADVILACRNPDRAANARRELLRDWPKASVSVMRLDLASLASVDAFAEELQTGARDIDVFVNNAGVFRQPGKKTADGFDLVIGTNYIGAYYLSERLLPYLATLPHEVVYVNTISIIHKIATVDYEDFYYEKAKR